MRCHPGDGGRPPRAVRQGVIQQGIEQGREDGVLVGRRSTLWHLFRLEFGVVPEEAVTRLDAADGATLDRWEEGILTATTLAEALG